MGLEITGLIKDGYERNEHEGRYIIEWNGKGWYGSLSCCSSRVNSGKNLSKIRCVEILLV